MRAVPPIGAAVKATPGATGASTTTSIAIALFVPAATQPTYKRRLKYVSASTHSVTIGINGGAAVALDVGPSSPQCVPASGGSQCSLTATAPPGNDTFSVVAWDEPAGAGNALSRTSVAATVTAGQTNTLPLTLNGVVGAVTVALPVSAPASGLAVTLPVVVNVMDPDNNVIVGPGTYVDTNGNAETITLSDSDASGATQLSTTSLTTPAAVTMTYSGAAIANVTLAPVLGSLPAGKLTPATITWGPAPNGPALTVDPTASRHAISPYIYGITWFYNNGNPTDSNFAAYAKAISLPISRHGGDGTSRYNWNVDATNAGNDFYFLGGTTFGPAAAVPSASVDHMISMNTSSGTKQILTIPNIEYINASNIYSCGFPKSLYPNQYMFFPYNSSLPCGDGYDASDGEIVPTAANLGNTDIRNSPSIQSAWVTHLVSTFQNAAHGGVLIYEMDNEITNWGFMHRDVHPSPVTCDEIVAQNEAYGAAVKATDPTALVLAPDDLPAADFFYCNNLDNSGQQEYPWYLQQMALYGAAHGRLLDYLSWHYPSAATTGPSDPYGSTVYHINELQGWINKYYPGTMLAFDEWNVGPTTNWTDTLLHADSWGLFGSMGVNLASFWGFGSETDPTAIAFMMFRDYDGTGGLFGDMSVSATTANTAALTVYAAQRTADGAKTIVVINKSSGALTSALTLKNDVPVGNAHVYQYSEASPGAIVHLPDQPFQTPYLVLTYPADSITTIVFS